MRALAGVLVAAALVLALARLFTGIVYRDDVPVALLVVKNVPDLRIERPERDGAPIANLVILDRDEPGLAYEPIYVATMRAAPFLVVAALLAALILVRRSRRQA